MAELARFTRADFLTRRWNYQPGESVFFCEPSQGGKTRWAFELMNATAHVRPPAALVMKPRDPTPAAMTRRFGWREVPSWPPPPTMPWAPKPPGYTLWPPHSLSLDPESIAKTNANLKVQFERCLMDSYMHGGQITFVDEIYGLLADLDMKDVINALLTRGMGMGAPLWYATQKPSGTIGAPMPGFVFNSWIHAFFGHDTVADNRRRLADVAGIDSQLIADTVGALQVYPTQTPYGLKPVSEKLYVNKNGPYGGYMCIVLPW